MNTQNLIIYRYPIMYQILKELEKDLNFRIIKTLNENSLEKETENLKDYLVITKIKLANTDNQLLLENAPIKIIKLMEIINIEFLKLHFNKQSKIKINQYVVNLNSREMFLNNTKLKLTEKEVNTIIYLSNSGKPVSISELQKNVWQYKSDIETHTVETHIYRLRKKIMSIFCDENFIINNKNGYQIK